MSNNCIYLGIDPATTTRIGFCAIDGDTIWHESVKDTMYLKRTEFNLYKHVQMILYSFREHKVHVAIEKPCNRYNAIYAIGKQTGVIELAMHDSPVDCEMHYVYNTSWKKQVVGKGDAEKADTIAFVKETTGLDMDEHSADAYCLAMYIKQIKESGEDVK